MQYNIFIGSAELIRNGKIQLEGSTDREGCLSHWFNIEDKYKVHLYELHPGKNVLGKNKPKINMSSCTCLPGSLQNPKYGSVCKHIVSCYFYLVDSYLKRMDKK